ncbi:hypothetical protein F2Q70_00020287 [Brassica cretica]|uniref:EF-hand domain-containing protein n=1 Tax=Brassica cretica TaxID=69181 RepID=A0A8S9GSR8_BRACR|nr:hypothetical protein F2Q70_00020287 [Brassica cretica]
MAAPRPTGSQDLFDTYFRRADLDGDGRISGAEAVGFFQGSNLPKPVLAQVWSYADAKKAGYLGRAEFYNALKLVTVAQSRRELTPEIVKAAIYSPASANIPAPKINLAATPSPQPRGPVTQTPGVTSVAAGVRGPQMGGNISTSNQQVVSGQQNQFTGPPPSQPPQNFQSHVISSTTTRPQVPVPASAPLDAPSNQLVAKELAASGNGFPSDSIFGDVFSVASTQPKQHTTGTTSTMGISSVSTGTIVAPEVAQSVARQSSIPQRGSLSQHPVGVQNQLTGNLGQSFVPAGAASAPTSTPTAAPTSPPTPSPDVQNVIAPPKEKSSAWKKEPTVSSNESADVSSSDVESKTEKKPSSGEEASEHSDGKTDRNGSLDDSNVRESIEADGSPRTKDTRSENGQSTASAGKTVNYDSHDETDSVSSFNPDNGKYKDHEKRDNDFGFGFGFDDFSIKPIKTGSTLSNDFLPPKLSIFSDSVPSPPANANDGFTAKPSLFDGSVPSTPATTTASYSGNKPYFDESVPSTPAYPGNLFSEKKSFFDSVPSTPAYPGSSFPEKKSFFDDSVPSTPAYPGSVFPEKKSFFDDSVPSTPAYSTSDFGGKPFASETPRSDSLFPGRSPFMFDSVPSTPAAHDDFSSNSFSRFDSFNSNTNDAFSLSRSDSMRSTSERDPFASRFDSFNYQRYDSFNAQSYDNNNASETPKASLSRFDSIGSTRDSDYSHGFGFDDHDPFGSTGPFKTTTTTAETPRSNDHWNAF